MAGHETNTPEGSNGAQEGVVESPGTGQDASAGNSGTGVAESPSGAPAVPQPHPSTVELQTQIQSALQCCWGGMMEAMAIVREKMLRDKVPRTDDGLTRALIGIAISLAKNNEVTDPNFIVGIVAEMWPQVIFTKPKKIIEATELPQNVKPIRR